jgi:hypothetical protein
MQEKASKAPTHFWVSLTKSIIRLAGCYTLYTGSYVYGAMFFALAEVLGIIEEF